MTSTDTPALLRVGIIGTGGISRAHAPGWQALDAELHAFSTEGAPAFGEQYGATIHPTLEALLDAVDVVDVCTPRSSTRRSTRGSRWCARSRWR
jgi:myo-inositol 2-dehydrogenase/D-chiro-inositol 1-dehydrogenase